MTEKFEDKNKEPSARTESAQGVERGEEALTKEKLESFFKQQDEALEMEMGEQNHLLQQGLRGMNVTSEMIPGDLAEQLQYVNEELKKLQSKRKARREEMLAGIE